MENSDEYEKGWTAYSMGVSINDCPYKSHLLAEGAAYGLARRKEWTQGWIDCFFAEEACNPMSDGSPSDIK